MSDVISRDAHAGPSRPWAIQLLVAEYVLHTLLCSLRSWASLLHQLDRVTVPSFPSQRVPVAHVMPQSGLGGATHVRVLRIITVSRREPNRLQSP